MDNTKNLAALLVLCILTACGGGGSDAPARGAEPVQYVPAAKLVVIGNSLAVVPADPAGSEWDHTSGAAASSADTDYAHLVAKGLGLPLTVSNFADLERNPNDAINKIDMLTPVEEQIAKHAASVTADSIVVVQLGDNALPQTMGEFGPAYGALLDAVAARRALVCVSTWWRDDSKDSVIRAACEAHGGRFVIIGDILHDPTSRDRIEGPQFQNASLQAHPHDWSMARIAARVLVALER
jgi:hypothetical protein